MDFNLLSEFYNYGNLPARTKSLSMFITHTRELPIRCSSLSSWTELTNVQDINMILFWLVPVEDNFTYRISQMTILDCPCTVPHVHNLARLQWAKFFAQIPCPDARLLKIETPCRESSLEQFYNPQWWWASYCFLEMDLPHWPVYWTKQNFF